MVTNQSPGLLLPRRLCQTTPRLARSLSRSSSASATQAGSWSRAWFFTSMTTPGMPAMSPRSCTPLRVRRSAWAKPAAWRKRTTAVSAAVPLAFDRLTAGLLGRAGGGDGTGGGGVGGGRGVWPAVGRGGGAAAGAPEGGPGGVGGEGGGGGGLGVGGVVEGGAAVGGAGGQRVGSAAGAGLPADGL